MLNLLPELYQCNNGGFCLWLWDTQWKPCSQSSQSPQGAPLWEWSYLHLTSARWLLDGLAQLLQRAWLQATSPHRGSLIWDNQEPNWWLKCIQSGPRSLISMPQPPLLPPSFFNSPLPGSVPDLTTQREGLPGPGAVPCCCLAHISWGLEELLSWVLLQPVMMACPALCL